jgi:hypothetical protein
MFSCNRSVNFCFSAFAKGRHLNDSISRLIAGRVDRLDKAGRGPLGTKPSIIVYVCHVS